MNNAHPGRIALLWERLVRFGFHLLYNQLAWTYDMVSAIVSLGAWRSWQYSALPYLRGPSVLELAHGTGHLLVKLDDSGYTVFGLDRSAAMGRLARRRLASQARPVPLVRGVGQELPFAAARFDSVVVTFPTDFILDPATLSEIRRSLRTRGRLVIVPAAYFTGRGMRHRALELLYAVTGQRSDPDLADPGQWDGWLGRLHSAGFEVTIHHSDVKGSVAVVLVCDLRDS